MADPLARYNAKRDFTRTAEPAGTLEPGSGNGFIVQKHDATRLHWDFRLEVDGVLKSWAVTRGPSLDPDEKRLAVRTEDHPLSYATFEGTIPSGEYGGGTVMLWDRGTWSPVAGKSAADLEDGHLHFILDGERMKGEWLLVRMKPRGREKRENWLLRKVADAQAGGTDTLTDQALTSVSTGRTMAQIAEGKPAKAKPAGKAKAAPRRTKAKKAAPPAFQPPALCTLVDRVPAGQGWLHEIKYDGYRALIAVGGGAARVFTRNGLDWSDKFPGIVAAAADLPVTSALVDGEIVAFKDGRPDFSTLKDAIGSDKPMSLFAFDLLSLDGEDLTELPLVQRKERLRAIVPDGDETIRFAEHVTGSGEALFDRLCAEGLEGVVSKQAGSRYPGGRSRDWLKAKCLRRQEFVIIGWLPSDKARRGFKSLLLGVNRDGKLTYVGKVGTGFTAARMDELRRLLDARARRTATVEAPRAMVRGAKWVRPDLVAEIAFTETTPDGLLRHPSFIGLREDKPADQVVEERPAPAPASSSGESAVTITHPDRVIFPDSDLTKGALADYVATVAPLMLPWVARRPVSLVRCPQGRARACFFQKHDAGSFGPQVHSVPIREKDGGTEPYLYVEDAEGLRACIQMGSIEFHGWGAGIAALEQPDRMIFDLDPDPSVSFDEVKRAAVHIHDQLAELGLTSFAMLSGGKGVHVVVPLTPDAEWPAVSDFAERFAKALAQSDPGRFVAVMTKAKRKGRIFIDWLRNQRGATAVMPYSARARAGAPVAAPVAWRELDAIDRAARWTIRDAAELVARADGAALRGWGVADQILPDL
ncbi:bifunctional non-homologous end joining protein LigD [Sphingomonas sp. SORGH_AS870]|uniref:DNA ligase D n=1 Tax=Sphingomonas sp. SORGH_AS_0870 TaxID=3041801 RepID=UPI0028656A34|nr:DNA ligase D [Sphingomonas sp. SORGH_AS_0870]MDR6145251.1 bifunctional non-homologous end joining protein LigD [Sphingomonas sp. SORGH_AS_0870]